MATKDSEWERAVASLRSGDKAGALFVFKKVAAQGYPAAFVEIGNIYELGGGGMERDLDEAIAWYQKAVDVMDDPKAHLALGRIYMVRRQSDEELLRARDHLLEVSESPGASFGLGMIYDHGWGVESDKEVATRYYTAAADQGHVMAAKRKAEILVSTGSLLRGIPAWIKASFELFRILSRNPDDRRIRVA